MTRDELKIFWGKTSIFEVSDFCLIYGYAVDILDSETFVLRKENDNAR